MLNWAVVIPLLVYLGVAFSISLYELIRQTRLYLQTPNSYQRRMMWLGMLLNFLPILIIPITLVVAGSAHLRTAVESFAVIPCYMAVNVSVITMLHRYKRLSGIYQDSPESKNVLRTKRVTISLCISSLLLSVLTLIASFLDNEIFISISGWGQIILTVMFVGWSIAVISVLQNRLVNMALKVFAVRPALQDTQFAEQMRRKADGKKKLKRMLIFQGLGSFVLVGLVVISQIFPENQFIWLIGIFPTVSLTYILGLYMLEILRDALKKKIEVPIKKQPDSFTKLSSVHMSSLGE